MKKFLIIIFLINGCSSGKNELNVNLSDIKFTDNLTIEEFQNKLKNYALTRPYPNIDK